ncbi:PAS domain-containing protein [Caulobacter sp.]|uniref:PAS domain-containing protein n=1 Tax=Caulobacter sp. TaxID=78 RepID=UPI00161D1369
MSEGRPSATPELTRIAGGQMAARVASFDWATSPLGPRADWSPSLSLAVDMILAANTPMALRWGPQLVLIYNDAYAPSLRERHPSALGIAFSDETPEIREALRQSHMDILDGASGGFAFEKLPLRVNRGVDNELAFFTVSYSPVPDATTASGVGGVWITAVEISDTVRIEKTLKTVQERYQMALEAAGGVGAWEWDLKADKIYADPRYAALHGLPPDEAEGGLPLDRFLPAVHPDDVARVQAQAVVALRAGGDFTEEYRLVQTDGRIAWVYVRGKAYLGTDGKARRAAGVMVDITERKSTEVALAAARAGMELAAQAAGIGRWDYDLMSGTRYWDPRVRAIFGIPADIPASAEVFEALMHPDDLAAVQDAVAATTDPNGPGTINLEYRIYRGADGALRWVEVSGRAFFEHGRCVRFVGVVSDVTERREALERQLRQDETLRLAVDAADVGAWDFDLIRNALSWSPGCYALFGVPQGDPVSLEMFYPLVHPDDRPRVREAMRLALDPDLRAEYAIEFRALNPVDGAERWIAVQGKTFFSEDGQAQRFVGAVVNITERKRAELHLRLLVNELNHRVKNSLATIQAIAAQSFTDGRSLDEAKAAFASRIVTLSEAHDLLTRENWEGADLHDVTMRLASLHGGVGRFTLNGPTVRLSPKTALSLSMALHELATNAVKYGALSVPDGRVDITWTQIPRPGAPRLELTWTERDGPPVTPPESRGFGSRLIERGLAAELSGSADIDFRPDGVVCRIEALLEA